MRKILLMSLITILTIVLTHGLALAITGQCSNCHTMHNYQNGQIVNAGGPYPQLLNADCIPCHTETTSGNVDPVNSFGAPIVWSTTLPGGQGDGFTTAGGDFYWVAQGGAEADKKGHNVAGIKAQDSNTGLTPPGWDPAATPGVLADGQIHTGAPTWSTQLRCAGLYGCHGNHSEADQTAAMRGAHHGNTGSSSTKAENPTAVGGSYRFLGGINGLEKSDWNWDENATNHNEYFGVTSNINYANKRTISYSCAQCHGVFHSQIDDATAGSPWLRHPTDIALPSDLTKEYRFYNPDGLPAGSGAVAGNTDYSIEAPVARSTVPTVSSKDVTPGTDIVMCLSCHRAHGSPQNDILRWDYTTMQVGVGTTDSGCFTCHTTKNAD
jgi:predicted CXXCH cytochrome family protein